MEQQIDAAVPAPNRRAFASFTNRDFLIFFFATNAAMMADNIEHVISYWVIFQKFHSPALQAFAVVSHWAPYLLFAAYTGALADRFDIRRLIQIGMLLFMGVSIGWGVMFLSDSTQQWKAMVLLVVHGLAGVIWMPASQVLIHKIVGTEQLSSAVRLNATGRYLAFLVGPAIGGLLLRAFGPIYGIFINALIYAPMFLWLIKVPYGPDRAAAPRPPGIRGFRDVWMTMNVVRQSPVLLSMTVLVGASAFLIGNAYQAQMPGYALDLGHGRASDALYSALLAADAAGGLAAGVILEARVLLPPNVRTAYILAMIWCCALAGFAQSHTYAEALILLFIAGFVELGFNSMAMALVQLNAPHEIRGRVIGVFTMSANGLRTFSGLSVGLLGAGIGIHNSLSYSGAALLLLYIVIIASRYGWRRRKAAPS
ncbi:MAG TPA: MFS transporter [Steroidobacteraceae bacterium]|nr:MFS transporter [Steroidobacteraceae bacterium]